jgi:hypothetical protein
MHQIIERLSPPGKKNIFRVRALLFFFVNIFNFYFFLLTFLNGEILPWDCGRFFSKKTRFFAGNKFIFVKISTTVPGQ